MEFSFKPEDYCPILDGTLIAIDIEADQSMGALVSDVGIAVFDIRNISRLEDVLDKIEAY